MGVRKRQLSGVEAPRRHLRFIEWSAERERLLIDALQKANRLIEAGYFDQSNTEVVEANRQYRVAVASLVVDPDENKPHDRGPQRGGKEQ